jgi:fructuronate reductase
MVLDDGLLGRELADHSAFTGRVAELIDVIVAHGPAAAATDAARAADADTSPLLTP